jgi:hypothetical protein
MPMPGDHIAADPADHGPPGPSQADREQVIAVLKTAFVQGRLTREEFGTRVGLAYTSQAYVQLTEVTADLPDWLIRARPPRPLARTRPWLSMDAALSGGAFAMIAALIGMMAAVASHSAVAVISVAVMIAIIGILAFGALIVASWRGRDHGGTAKIAAQADSEQQSSITGRS